MLYSKLFLFQCIEYFVYILTNKTKTTLYIGVTNNLKLRINQHSNPSENSTSFTKLYNVVNLVFYELHNNIKVAIAREKELKKWRREKKDKLIFSFNPEWIFLNDTL